MKQFVPLISAFIFILLLSQIAFAAPNNDDTPENLTPILEITDKYNEVRFGLTKHSVYMIFSEHARITANQSFRDQYKVDTQNFEDSKGNFLVAPVSFLESNRLEYNVDDIKEINFDNGKLSFTYKNKQAIGFEDIYSFNGTKALNNFYVEDLEDFIFTFTKNLKS